VTFFLTAVLTIWGLLHLFVGWHWQRLGVPAVWVWPAAFVLWASYPIARWAEWHWLEYLAANWIGILFLQFALLLVADLITLGGAFWPAAQRYALIAAGLLSGIALIQGHRDPVIREYEVSLPGLRRELTLVAMSDLHLGSLLGERWAGRLIARVTALQPDIVCLVGDLVDINVDHVEDLLPTLRQLRAPLGVWAVTGNHEFYAGIERSVALHESAGYTVLRDRWVEVMPGLVIGGIDDLTARPTKFDESLLAARPPGAAILLSHTPVELAGPELVLSGHTHGGQLWPFNYLVRLRHRMIGGRYDRVIVSRGAGTWGPRMRLWRPGEILRIRLRGGPAAARSETGAERLGA
jgi:predicted MPP superfamily phosphohydrolase